MVWGGLARPARFERTAFRLGGKRSIRLSYGRNCIDPVSFYPIHTHPSRVVTRERYSTGGVQRPKTLQTLPTSLAALSPQVSPNRKGKACKAQIARIRTTKISRAKIKAATRRKGRTPGRQGKYQSNKRR